MATLVCDKMDKITSISFSLLQGLNKNLSSVAIFSDIWMRNRSLKDIVVLLTNVSSLVTNYSSLVFKQMAHGSTGSQRKREIRSDVYLENGMRRRGGERENANVLLD